MEKRGLSGFVTMLILILLSLVAVGIVWGIIRNAISESTDEISLEDLKLDLRIEKVVIGDGEINVTVKRNTGRGSFNSLKFIVSSGERSEIFDVGNVDMDELDTQVFNLPYLGIVNSVSIAPQTIGDGSPDVGDLKDQFIFTKDETIKNIPGILSWWDLNGDSVDKLALNPGVVNGALSTSGKFGQSYLFDGTDDYISAGTDQSLNITGDITVSAWVKLASDTTWDLSNLGHKILAKDDGATFSSGSDGYFLSIYDDAGQNKVFFSRRAASGAGVYIFSNSDINSNQWYFITATMEGTNMSIYIDGNLDNTLIDGDFFYSSAEPFRIGAGDDGVGGTARFFNGSIDEVMVFDRALSVQEVKDLYEFDLS